MNYRGEKRSNETHESKSDPEAQHWRARSRGRRHKLSYSGNVLVENRNGLIVDSRVWEATGTTNARRRWKCCRRFREASG